MEKNTSSFLLKGDLSRNGMISLFGHEGKKIKESRRKLKKKKKDLS